MGLEWNLFTVAAIYIFFIRPLGSINERLKYLESIEWHLESLQTIVSLNEFRRLPIGASVVVEKNGAILRLTPSEEPDQKDKEISPGTELKIAGAPFVLDGTLWCRVTDPFTGHLRFVHGDEISAIQ